MQSLRRFGYKEYEAGPYVNRRACRGRVRTGDPRGPGGRHAALQRRRSGLSGILQDRHRRNRHAGSSRIRCTPISTSPSRPTTRSTRLFAGYLVAKGDGAIIKTPAKIEVDPGSGQIVTTFGDSPDQPFSDLTLHFKSGNRGLLTTASGCGTYQSTYELTPWSGTAPVTGVSTFKLDENCEHHFAPSFSAGSSNPLAGAFTTFVTRVTRDAGVGAADRPRREPPAGSRGEARRHPLLSRRGAGGRAHRDRNRRIGDRDTFVPRRHPRSARSTPAPVRVRPST